MEIGKLLETHLNSEAVAAEIKQRVTAINEAAILKKKLTLKRLFEEAGVSIFTYRSWAQGRNPSHPSLEAVVKVLKKYEKRCA